jgi:TPR repeat protein
MSIKDSAEGDRLYEEAKKYNRRENPANAVLAYSMFARAADSGHTQAKAKLAEMMFFGSGGPKEQVRAMALTWQVFAPSDFDPLESLTEQLHIYADELLDPVEQVRALQAAEKLEAALQSLRDASGYVMTLAQQRMVELQRSKP